MGSKKPEAERYTICIYFAEDGGSICNKTGEPKDNFFVHANDMSLFRCMPEDDFSALSQELFILRNGQRKGH